MNSLQTAPAQAEATSSPLLAIRSVEVTYEKVEIAIRGISIDVMPGRIVSVLGANGAGKTSLLRAVSGFLPGERAAITEGTVSFDGTDITNWKPNRVSKAGIVSVPEREKIFPSLTVAENLRVGERRSNGTGARFDEAAILDLFPALQKYYHKVAGYLSGGERQMLALGSALLCGPRVLLIDEMSLGLAPKLVDELFAMVADVVARVGLTVLVVEQNAAAALGIADYVYILESGRVVLDGTPERMLEHEDVREFYLGVGAADDDRSFADVKQYRRARRWYG